MIVVVRLDERFTCFVLDLFVAHRSCESSYLCISESCDESVANLTRICAFVQGLGVEKFAPCVISVGD